MGGAVPGMALEQARRGLEQEQQERAVGLGQIERALQGALGGARVAERVPGDRLQQESLEPARPAELPGAEPSRTGASAAAAACGSCWASRSTAAAMRISPRSRSCSPRPARACSARSVSPRRTRACSQPCPRHRDEVVRRGEVPGQPLGGPEGGQRVGVTAARQLEQPADVVDRHRRRGLGFRSDGALGALDPGLGLLEPPLPDQRSSEYHVGVAGGRLVGPAVPFGQPDRLPAALRRPRRRPEISIAAWCARPVNSRYGRPIRRASTTPCVQVPLRLLEPGRPELGDAEADQRQRAQLLAQAGLRRVRSLGHGPQPPRLLRHRRDVAALPGQQQPDHPQQHLQLPAPQAGTDADPRSASPRYRSAASSDPCASSSAATSAASSASAARASAGNPASSACTVAACPPSRRPGQSSASSRAASPQSCAAWACRIASTGYPCPAYHPAAT